MLRNHSNTSSPIVGGKMVWKGVLLSFLVMTMVAVAGVFWSVWPTWRITPKTYGMIYIGMPESEVYEMLGEPGWNAGFGRTAIGIGRLEPYFASSGIREDRDGEITKAWADNGGIIIVTFQDGFVLSKSFEPVFFGPTYVSRTKL